MKTILLITALVGCLALAHAQEPAASNGSPAESGTAPVVPMDEGSLLPAATGSGLILYPSAAAPAPAAEPELALPTETAAPAPSPLPTEITKGGIEKIRMAVRIREIKTIALEDPAVQAQKEGARCAKTEAGRCVWMRNFYTLLYTKMEKLDPSLHEVLETQLHDILGRYEQRKVRPSILIENVAELPGSHSEDHVPAKSASRKKST